MTLSERSNGLLFKTYLKKLPELQVSLGNNGTRLSSDEPSLKKHARQEISLQHTNDTLGFLHASMVSIGEKFYLLAGPSKVGKSTYGKMLERTLGAEIVASDWVAVEKEGESFFASDLNYPESLRHSDRCLLAGIIFLTNQDDHHRDAFTPNPEEYSQLLAATFDTADPQQLTVLTQFWLLHKDALPLCYAVPTRQNNEQYVGETLLSLLHRATSKVDEVGVIGLGSLGTQLAFEIGRLDSVKHVHLYNRTSTKTTGYALDMNQGVPEKGSQVFVPQYDPAEVFLRSSVVFLCFRDQDSLPSSNENERWQKIAAHLKIMRDYAVQASEAHFMGTIFILTNPIDILTYVLYYTSQSKQNSLRTYQTYGLGLELDVARQLYFAREEGLQIDPADVQAYGNHSDTFVVKSPVPLEQQEQLSSKVKDASSQIRKYVPRTVFGPVAAAKKSFLAFQQDGTTSLALVQKKTYLGQPIQFRNKLPMFLPLITDESYEGILRQNQQNSQT